MSGEDKQINTSDMIRSSGLNIVDCQSERPGFQLRDQDIQSVAWKGASSVSESALIGEALCKSQR